MNTHKGSFSAMPWKKTILEIVKKQKQIGSHDCGLFAITTATAILSVHDATFILVKEK